MRYDGGLFASHNCLKIINLKMGKLKKKLHDFSILMCRYVKIHKFLYFSVIFCPFGPTTLPHMYGWALAICWTLPIRIK